ncbi:MAG: SMC-Scp complex subunit ScpB [Acidimicrobiia bacterium]|nr:SMC-Scp complex subunit ScpB [Acidimicrobiia bacterium]MDX2466617.1 SMC-Scp complex subunit ScpB [Acidimicrobiia bacterium]
MSLDLRAVIEAMLFVAEEPIPLSEMSEVLEEPQSVVADELKGYLADLEESNRGLVLRELGGGWRLFSHPDARPYLERFAATDRVARLSKAALETLAVVAYKQPVSRGQVSEIRGVDSDRALRTLERRGMITEIGTAPGPGQAMLFGTTPLFMEKLGVRSLEELPPLADHVPPKDVVDALERPFRPEESSTDFKS